MDIPQNAPLAYVSFSAEISTDTTESLISIMSNLANFTSGKSLIFYFQPPLV